jgi:hypothetical protein
MLNKIPITISICPAILIIETSSLQEFGQCYRSYETQKRPGQGNINIKIFSGHKRKNRAETDYHNTQYIDGYGPVRCSRASPYPVKAQKAADAQADIK